MDLSKIFRTRIGQRCMMCSRKNRILPPPGNEYYAEQLVHDSEFTEVTITQHTNLGTFQTN